MANTPKPQLLKLWAESGAVVQPSDIKIEEGWIAEKPPFQTENWIQNRTDLYLKHLDESGIPEWDTVSQYHLGSVTIYAGEVWQSTAANNVNNVPTVGLGFWELWEFLSLDGSDTLQDYLKVVNNAGVSIEDSIGDSQVVVRWLANDTIEIGAVTDSNTLNSSVIIKQGGANRLIINPTTLNFNGNTVWHSGNFDPSPFIGQNTWPVKLHVASSIMVMDSLPAGWTFTSTGLPGDETITITHNFGHTNYVVTSLLLLSMVTSDIGINAFTFKTFPSSVSANGQTFHMLVVTT